MARTPSNMIPLGTQAPDFKLVKTGKPYGDEIWRIFNIKNDPFNTFDKILLLNPQRIYTDRLPLYRSIIPKNIHKVFQYCTNKIERNNLTLRTHIKRLSRKTICFSKNKK